MTNDTPRVTVAGGGIAGMTAALRLAERGYQVTLYEQKPMLVLLVSYWPLGEMSGSK